MDKIPKIIHYCWFGKGEMPDLVKKCIGSWRKILPDYKFILWDENNFDISSKIWTKTAYDAKKYAFVADYVRLYALYNYGGIYLDTDIQMKKSFNNILSQTMFIGFECNNVLSAGVIGCVPKMNIIKELLEYYNQEFSQELINTNTSNALVMTEYLELKYNLKRDNTEQYIADNVHVYPKTFFNPRDFWGNWDLSKDTYCIHLYMGSWLPQKEMIKLGHRRTLWFRIGKYIYDRLRSIKIVAKIRTILNKFGIV